VIKPETRIVDALGTWCPVPIQILAKVMKRLSSGSLVELLADDPLIEIDLPAWCHDEGHALLGIVHEEGEPPVIRLTVRRI
jgi:tRNA 2-thiouridine synthesizing protein A